MSEKPRTKLSIGRVREGLLDEAEDAPFELATLDFTLPCRRFLVDHKIADVGKVSVTAEFLLRFLRSMTSCTEETAQSFFGYSRREMAYVLNEVEDADYVQRNDGRISLTATGANLFRPGVEEPLIYEVERRSARVGFDLISLAPAERKFLSYFDRNLPELPLHDAGQVSSAAERVPVSFRRFFREFAPKIDADATIRRSLYSIDAVLPEERFSTLVRVKLQSTGLKPSLAEIDLSEWKSDYELSDREAVTRAVAETVERMMILPRQDDEDAFNLLLRLAPDYLKEWTRRDGLSVPRYYRHAFTSHGDIRANRQTAPVVGSLFTLENARRLFEVANYGLRKTKRAIGGLYWVVPQTPFWGSTTILQEAVDRLCDQVNRTNEDLGERRPVSSFSLCSERPERWVKEAFERHHSAESRAFPAGFEMLLVPGAFVAASVHSVIGQPAGLPVPLGFVSFDSRVVANAMQLLAQKLPLYKLPEAYGQDCAPILVSDEEPAVPSSPV